MAARTPKKKAPKHDAAWAVETLRATLEGGGHTLQSAEVIYKKVVLWGAAKARLFLVKYLRGDGYASVGCVGPFVRLLDDLPMADIEALPAKTVNRRLIELYVGQFFIDRDHASTEPSSPCTEAMLQTALLAYSGKLTVSKRLATAGAANLKRASSVTVPAKHCALTCHDPPESIELEGLRHVIASATLTFDLSCGGTAKRQTGSVEARSTFYIRLRDGQMFEPPRPLWAGRLSFPNHPLANVLGAIYGPGEVLDKWGWAHFSDR